jgi:hypothetical protein
MEAGGQRDVEMLADLGLFSEVSCPAKCEAGFLFRAEKTDTGMKGLFVSLSSDDRNSYAVTLDANGKILTKEKLQPNMGMGAQGGLANEAGNIDPEKLKMIMKTGIKILRCQSSMICRTCGSKIRVTR